MGLFGWFGKKKTASAKEETMGPGSEGGMSPDMMIELAGMPDAARKQMIKGRLEQLLVLSDDQRPRAMQGMISAIFDPKVKESDREKLVATRTEIIGEFSEDRRRTMMMSRMTALMDAPDLNKADRDATEKTMPQVPAEARTAFMETMKAVMDNPPQS